MRDFLNAILAFIGSTSLTDGEFSALTIITYAYDEPTYNALAAVLVARGAVSTSKDRLTYFFKSKGIDLSIDATATVGTSNIYIGDAL